MSFRSRGLPATTRLLAAASLVLAAACARHDDSAVDSTLNRDLAMAGQSVQPSFTPGDTALNPNARVRETPRAPTTRASTPRPAAQPQRSNPTRVATAPAPARETPTRASSPEPSPAPVVESPAPAPAATGSRGSGLAGTALAMSTGSRVCTNNRPGDKLIARVGSSSGPGAGSIPAGSTVVLEVANIEVNEASPEQSRIIFRVRQITVGDVDYPGNGTTIASEGGLEKVNTTPTSSDTKKAAAGAIAGAILGQVIGHNTKSTVIGAAAGGVTGAVVGRATRKYEGCLPAGAPLHVTLSA